MFALIFAFSFLGLETDRTSQPEDELSGIGLGMYLLCVVLNHM